MPLLLANAGLPMIGVQMHLMVIALLPIVAVEAVILRQRLSAPFSRVLLASLLANALSTLVGIPLTWIALALIELTAGGGAAWGLETPLTRLAAVTVQSPWLIPYEDDLHWMIPAASLSLLIPSLVVSALVESCVLIRLFPVVARRRVRATSWIANGLSYLLLMAYVGVRLYQQLGTRP